MGQKCLALAFGVVVTKELRQVLRAPSGEYLWFERGDPNRRILGSEQAPRSSDGGDALGFVFACELPEDGEADLLERTLLGKEMDTAFPCERDDAKVRWREFSEWAEKSCGIHLPAGQTLLMAVERS